MALVVFPPLLVALTVRNVHALAAVMATLATVAY